MNKNKNNIEDVKLVRNNTTIPKDYENTPKQFSFYCIALLEKHLQIIFSYQARNAISVL